MGDARLVNLGKLLSPSIFTGFLGADDAAIGARRYHQYYETSTALGPAGAFVGMTWCWSWGCRAGDPCETALCSAAWRS